MALALLESARAMEGDATGAARGSAELGVDSARKADVRASSDECEYVRGLGAGVCITCSYPGGAASAVDAGTGDGGNVTAAGVGIDGAGGCRYAGCAGCSDAGASGGAAGLGVAFGEGTPRALCTVMPGCRLGAAIRWSCATWRLLGDAYVGGPPCAAPALHADVALGGPRRNGDGAGHCPRAMASCTLDGAAYVPPHGMPAFDMGTCRGATAVRTAPALGDAVARSRGDSYAHTAAPGTGGAGCGCGCGVDGGASGCTRNLIVPLSSPSCKHSASSVSLSISGELLRSEEPISVRTRPHWFASCVAICSLCRIHALMAGAELSPDTFTTEKCSLSRVAWMSTRSVAPWSLLDAEL